MIWYLSMLCISLVFAELFRKTDKHKNLFMCLSTLPFILISGLRYDVGTDYMYRYTPDFNWMSQGNDPANIEIGFKILMRIILFFSNHVQYLFFITSIFTIGIIFCLIFKQTKFPSISILVFFFGGYFFNSMNILRQYMAMALLLCAFHYLLKNDIKKWIVLIIIAALFHTTALIFILSIIPYILKFDIKKMGILSACLFIFGVIIKPILLMLVQMTRFNVYLVGTYADFLKGDFQLIQTLVILLIVIIYFYIYYTYQDQCKNDIKLKAYICLQIIALLFAGYTSIMYIATRFVVFFSIFTIFGISIIFNYMKNKKQVIILSTIIGIIYISSFNYLYLKNNVDEVFPYKYRFLYHEVVKEGVKNYEG